MMFTLTIDASGNPFHIELISVEDGIKTGLHRGAFKQGDILTKAI